MVDRAPIAKAIEVLVWLADHPQSSSIVRQVARDLHMSPSTIHRVFRVFEEQGLFSRDNSGAYIPSLELYRVCQKLAARMSPIEIIRPHLEALAHLCGEAVLLLAYEPRRREMMIADKVDSPHPIGYLTELNSWGPIHAGASGIAILASLSDDERELVYKDSLRQMTDRTLVARDELEAAVRKTRKQGYLCTKGQRTIGAVGIAAPLFDSADEVFGDVCITIPQQRFEDRMERGLSGNLLNTCAAIQAAFRRAGYRRL